MANPNPQSKPAGDDESVPPLEGIHKDDDQPGSTGERRTGPQKGTQDDSGDQVEDPDLPDEDDEDRTVIVFKDPDPEKHGAERRMFRDKFDALTAAGQAPDVYRKEG